MIDVQEQLLLDSLTAFASVVSKPALTRGDGDVSWRFVESMYWNKLFYMCSYISFLY